MRPALIYLSALSILLIPNNNVGGGIVPVPPTQEVGHIAQVDKRPKLAADISTISRFKAASRKTTYHVGEMINIDLALLNISDKPVYFRRLSNVEAYSSDISHGKERSVKYVIKEVMPTPDTYVLLNPNKMFSISYQLLAGCDPRAFQEAKEQLSATESRTVFDKELFINWGDSCLPIKQPGVYTLSFEVTNWFVVVPSGRATFLTGVGTLKSNPLTIRITK